MNIYVETYGCAANKSDSEIMKGLLNRAGFLIVENEKPADIVILNTCIVKEPTLKRMERRIKHFSLEKKKLIVAGCMPEVLYERIRQFAPQASMVSTHHIKEICKVIRKVVEGKKVELIGRSQEVKVCMPRIPQNKNIGIVQIASGCVNQCAYCIVKEVKGLLFSYPQNMILKDIEQNLKDGCKKIWLTSQDNGAYDLDFGKHELPELLKKIIALKGKFSIRIGMMNPSSLLPIVDKMVECYKSDKVFKFLHLPVQSGSDRILKKMNRSYKVKDFIDIVRKFRKEFSEFNLATDIIVGFPGETEKDFEKTLALIKKIKPEVLNISKFWPMPGTKAACMEQLPETVKKKRAVRLMSLYRKNRKTWFYRNLYKLKWTRIN